MGKHTFSIGRRADDGRLTTVKEAKEHPKTHTMEQMPKPGRVDTDPRK